MKIYLKFYSYISLKYFKEIKCSKSLQKAEVYLRWSFFVNIFNDLLFSQ